MRNLIYLILGLDLTPDGKHMILGLDLMPDGKHILVRCRYNTLFCRALVWDILRLRALILCSFTVVVMREELYQCIG